MKFRPKKAVSLGTIDQFGSPVEETISISGVYEPVKSLSTNIIPVQGKNEPKTILSDDFDEEDITNAYGALLETGALVVADVEIQLNEERIKKRGRQLYKIMQKYNLNIEYIDLMFVGVGVLGDCVNVYQQVKIAKSTRPKTESTETETETETQKPEGSNDFRELQMRVKI